jgi:LacI family transcriptional regulator
MADVARIAGVSLQTVSRAINDKGEISEETKEYILDIACQLGYRPSAIARGLATRRTTTIGLVVPDISNPFFSGIARGVEDVAYTSSYNVFLCNTNEDIEREHAVLDSLLEKEVDGLIVCSSRLEEEDLEIRLREFRFAILVNRKLENSLDGIGYVVVKDDLGALIAVNFLVEKGHRHIALLAGPQRSWSGKNRLKGYQDGLALNNLSLDSGAILFCEPNICCGYETTCHIIQHYSETTAIIAYNDLVAVGALQACKAAGRNVPGEMAVIGADDIPLASMTSPPLTTLSILTVDIGKEAMRLLMNIMSGEIEGSPEIQFEPRLVVRESAP